MEPRRFLDPLWRLLMPPWTDPRYLDRRFQQEGPCVRYRQFGREVVAVRGLALGLSILRAGGPALRSPELPYTTLIPRGFLRFMSPEDRSRYRPLVASSLSSHVVKARTAEIHELIRRALPRLGDGPPRAALRGLALQVVTRLLVGLPGGDPDEAAFLRAVDGLPLGHRRIVRRHRAGRQLAQAVEVLRRRCVPGDVSFVGVLLAGRADALADETLARNLVYAVRTGGSDLGSFLHWLLWELARSPEWLQRGTEVREADAIVHETLRLHQSEYLYRRAERAIEDGEVDVPRGGLLRLCVAESHRDPEMFPNPERWDPSRFLENRPPREEYMPFGAPGTSCVGAALSIAVARAFVRQLSAYRVTVAADGPHEHDGWHWRPSGRFRVSLQSA